MAKTAYVSQRAATVDLPGEHIVAGEGQTAYITGAGIRRGLGALSCAGKATGRDHSTLQLYY